MKPSDVWLCCLLACERSVREVSADRQNQINNTAWRKDKTPSDQTWSDWNTESSQVRALRFHLLAEWKKTKCFGDPLLVKVKSAIWCKTFLLFSVSYDNKRRGFGSNGSSVKRRLNRESLQWTVAALFKKVSGAAARSLKTCFSQQRDKINMSVVKYYTYTCAKLFKRPKNCRVTKPVIPAAVQE